MFFILKGQRKRRGWIIAIFLRNYLRAALGKGEREQRGAMLNTALDKPLFCSNCRSSCFRGFILLLFFTHYVSIPIIRKIIKSNVSIRTNKFGNQEHTYINILILTVTFPCLHGPNRGCPSCHKQLTISK